MLFESINTLSDKPSLSLYPNLSFFPALFTVNNHENIYPKKLYFSAFKALLFSWFYAPSKRQNALHAFYKHR